MLIIIGLGNPGKKYELTRHNVGFMVIDNLAGSAEFSGGRTFRMREEYRALISKGVVSGDKAMLVKPQTYMNNSGRTLAGIMQSISEPVGGLLVVADDYNLPFGAIRFRREGSSGGHKGLQSIVEQLGNNKFHRLRIGIGLPERVDPVEFVLERFTKTEEKEMQQIISRAVEAIIFYVQNGIEKSMNKYNCPA
ncbi:MAG: aminoacyl-tRNA hydrolase [Planctomycetota bacterium]